VISHGEPIAREPGANNEIVRQRIRAAIEQTLSSKGLRQVSEPRDAEFLVDYHVAVRRHDVTVERVYPGGYPGLVCGPMDAGNRGAGGRRKSATKIFASAKARWSLICEAIDEAAGVSRDRSKAGAPRYVQSR